MTRFIATALATGMTALVVAAAPVSAADADKQAQGAITLPAIIVTPVERTQITDRVRGSGLVSPVEQVSVQPQIEGQAVDSLEAEVGDTVEEGQVLARLSEASLTLKKSQLEAQRAAAEASIAQAEAQLVEAQAAAEEAERVRERAKTLAGKGIGAKASAEQAASSAAAAQARVNSARQAGLAAQAQLKLVDAQIADLDLQLERTQIKAPVGGLVAQRNARVGAIASAAGQPMFVILRGGELELRAEVAEQDLLRLAPGQKASVRVSGVAEPIPGVVRLVEPTVDTNSRLGVVRIAIEEPQKVRWGMFADAEIVAEERETLVLPTSAVGMGPDGATALKVVDGVVDLVSVKTGIREGDRVEILSGLESGDKVVAKAGAFVRDGDRINPVAPDTVAGVSN